MTDSPEEEETIVEETGEDEQNREDASQTIDVELNPADEGEDIAGGEEGGLTWRIDAYGNLTVSGTRDEAYEFDSGFPWKKYYKVIETADVNVEMQDASGLLSGISMLTSAKVSGLSTAKDMSEMFANSTNLTSVDLSGANPQAAERMDSMFEKCFNLKKVEFSPNFKFAKHVDSMFANIRLLEEVNFCDVDTSSTISMDRMFQYCDMFNEPDFSHFDTSNVTSMEHMFCWFGQYGVKKLDLSHFDTSKVENMYGMFSNCNKLTSITFGEGFDTSNVRNMSFMFGGCSSLTELDLSGFDTSKVTDMSAMFMECSSLTELDLSGFDTSKVTNMSSMFEKCSSLTELDVSKFNTENAKNMYYMFRNCNSLRELDLSSFYITVFVYVKLFSMDGEYALSLIKSPYYVSRSLDVGIALPDGNWYCEDGSMITEFPPGLNHSIIVTRDRIPGEEVKPITSCTGGTINGKGYSYGKVRLVRDGKPLANKAVRWSYDGFADETVNVSTDEKGYVRLRSPLLFYRSGADSNTYDLKAAISFQSGDMWIRLPETYTMHVEVEPMSFSEAWTLEHTLNGEVSAGLTVGAGAGPARVKAEIGEVSGSISAGGVMELSHEQEDGKRKLGLTHSLSGEIAAGVSLGPAADLEFANAKGKVTVANADGGINAGRSVSYGMEIEDYQASPEQLKKIGKFLATVQLYTTSNWFLEKIFKSIGFDVYDTKSTETTVAMSAGAAAGGVEMSDSSGDNTYFSANVASASYDRTYTVGHETDRRENTEEYSFGIASDREGGVLNVDGMGEIGTDISLLSFGEEPINTEIGFTTDSNGNISELSFTDTTYESWGGIIASSATSREISYSTTDTEVLQNIWNNSSTLKKAKIAGGSLIFPEKAMASVWSTAVDSAEDMEFTVSESKENSISLPLSAEVQVLAGLGLGIELGGGYTTSYEINKGEKDDDKLSITSSTAYTAEDIEDSKVGLGEILKEAIWTIGNEFIKWVVELGEDAKEKIVSFVDGSIVGKVIHVFAFNTDKDRSRMEADSYAIRTFSSGSLQNLEEAGTSMTVAMPYIIYVTEGEDGPEISDFTDSPVLLTLPYTEEDLTAAGITDGDASSLGIYRFDDKLCGYVYMGGTLDAEHKVVSMEITKPGQYILATDGAAPRVTRIYASDTSPRPTITAFFDEFSGFSAFSMKIDGIEYVDMGTLKQHMNYTSGCFVYKVEEPLDEGEHILTFEVADMKGNASPEPITFTFTVCRQTIVDLDDSDEGQDETSELLPEDIPEDGKIPNGLWVAKVADAIYTGSAVKPEPHVYESNVRLIKGKDYTVSYARNTKAYELAEGDAGFDESNAPVIVIKGKGNYTGQASKPFKILKKDITEADVAKELTDAYKLPDAGKNPVLVFSAKYKGKALKKGVDYSLSVKDETGKVITSYGAEGTYTISIKGTGNFTGTYEAPFRVADLIPVSSLKVGKLAVVSCDGTEKKPKPVISYNKKSLKEESDYTLSYRNNISAGTASVVITGKGDYFGIRTVHFTIKGTAIKSAKIAGFESSVPYTGAAVKQTGAALSYNGALLKEGSDYSVSYSNNVMAGKAAVVYTGMGSYTGTVKKTYKITPYSMETDADARIRLGTADITAVYEKGGTMPGLEVYDGDKRLVAGRDYTLSYANNKEVRQASASAPPTITVKGKGNYTGTLKKTKVFTITAKDLAAVSVVVSDVKAATQKGKFQPKPVLMDTNGKKLLNGTDYTNVSYSYRNETTVKNKGTDVTRAAGTALEADDIVPAGTVLCVKAQAKEGGNYTGSSRVAEYRVTEKLISGAKVTVKNPEQENKNLFPYTGKGITLNQEMLTVKMGTTALTSDQYEILEDTYQNNVKTGTASVTIRGKGIYGGTKVVKFKIGPKKMAWIMRLFGQSWKMQS